MKYFLLLLCMLSLSCELHEQTNFIGDKSKAKIVNQSVLEEISSAILQNDLDAIKELLGDGDFEINVPDKAGELILNKAIKGNKFVIGNFLLKKGASPEIEDEEGESGQSIALAGQFSQDWKNLFKQESLTVNTANSQIFNYLEGANSNNERKFMPVVNELINLGASIDGVNEGGFTYLMIASSKNLLIIVDLFCRHPEIDPNISIIRGRGSRQQTFNALTLATSDEMRLLLKKCGATD